MTTYKLVFNFLKSASLIQAIKFTGTSQMVEAKLGELSTLDQSTPGATILFIKSDAQYTNASTFATPIVQEDTKRILTSNVLGNVFINRFAVVKRIEVTGKIIQSNSEPGNVYQDAPVLTGDFYNGHLMTPNRQNMVFSPDNDFTVAFGTGTANGNVQYSRFYWEGTFLFSAFTNWVIRLNSGATTVGASNVVFYFDELLPMARYHEYLANQMAWNTGCQGVATPLPDLTVENIR